MKLDYLDETMNHRQALKAINTSGMSRKGLYCNFIRDGDQCYCLITLCDKERAALPTELSNTSISYKNLKVKAMS